MALVVAVALVLGLLAAPAGAAEEGKKMEVSPPRPQAEKMRLCNKEATERQLKGDDRKDFLRVCLKGDGGKERKS
jgi:hypothetical protein